jgi:very-short-patch-repair endonuclease
VEKSIIFSFTPALKGVENLGKSVNFRFTTALKGTENLSKVALFLNHFFYKCMVKNSFKSDYMWKGVSPQIFSNAKKLRENLTEAEEKLWLAVKNKQIEGYKFRRQHPIAIYIADFYCHALKLVIEIDGGYHLEEEQRLLDEKRTNDIEFQGLKVMRFTNEEILLKFPEVIDKIKMFIKMVS